ncbi:hypothetical protein [Salinigranum sp. GCM10025319]|uniref:hypothetical protein n=1 Tax=Salinigranum sp. GCM10025319 TaxID=3252687 RepID=UPI00360A0E53
MDDHRGTTPEIEERRVRLRPENDAVGTWLERLFDAAAEFVLFAIPALVLVVLFNNATLSGRVIVTATGFIVVGAAVKRRTLAVGAEWPKTNARSSVARFGYFNAVVVAGMVLPGAVDVATGGGPALVLPAAFVVGVLSAGAFPPLVAAIGG